MIGQAELYRTAFELFLIKHRDDEIDPTPGWRNELRMKAWQECVAIALDLALSCPETDELARIAWNHGERP